MKRAFIIHGYGATPEDHWFSWLGQQLQAAGVATAIPALPAPEQPDFYHWQAALAAHIGRPDAQTVFVAHSLGTISLLHFLSAARPTQIGGIYLVAGFDRVVAPAASMQLAERLGGAVHRVANGGHFLASDGFHTLPLLWQAMQAGGV